MKKIVLVPLFSIGVILFLNHCSTNGVCTESTESLATLKFYTIINGKETDTSVYSLTLYGTPPPDSNEIIYNGISNVNSLVFPMDHTQDFCSFDLTFHIPDTIFTIDTTIVSIIDYTDHITFQYERSLQLITPECGFGYYFILDSILHTNTIIKSIEIINPLLTPENYGDIKVYI